MSDGGAGSGVRAGWMRTAAAVPAPEAARLTEAVTGGLEAAAGPGYSLRLSSLHIKVPAGASSADIASAVRRAIEAARTGRRR